MAFVFFWLLCIALSGILASAKRQEVWAWVIIGVFLGPLGLLILLFIPAKSRPPEKPYIQDYSLAELKSELDRIKDKAVSLSSRLKEIEERLNVQSGAGIVPERPAEQPKEILPVQEQKTGAAPAASMKQDMELKLGKYWLNKIGIIVFTLGVGFLITYTFRYFGAWARIAFGYMISGFLFFAGTRLERQEKFLNYGRVLLGGAWALVYFTTYAMHHFDASRILDSQLLDLLLLAMVSAGIIMHSLKYRSQELSACALFIGYITATMGDVNYFTLLSCALLTVIALILVYRMQWIQLIFMGIILAYATHLAWVLKHIYLSRVELGTLDVRQVYFFINSGFLFLYWFLFTAGIHLVLNRREEVNNRLASANFINCLLFFCLVYPKIVLLYPGYRFIFVFGLGLVYLALSLLAERLKNKRLYTGNTIIAVLLLTLSVPLKFFTYHTTIIWLVELPFLLYTGIVFDRRVFRYLSVALSAAVFIKFLTHDYSAHAKMSVFDYRVGWNSFLACAGFLSTLCGYCIYRLKKYEAALEKGAPSSPLSWGAALNDNERFLRNVFSGMAAAYLASWIVLLVDPYQVTFWLSLEIMLLAAAALFFSDAYLRFYTFLLSLVVSYRYVFLDRYHELEFGMQWFIIASVLAILYTLYFVFRYMDTKTPLGDAGRIMKNTLFCVTTSLLVYTLYEYVMGTWLSLTLGMSGLLLFITGFISKDKFFRIGGFVVFAITILRIFFVDLSGLPIIYKFISFIILGILFLGVSFGYNKFNIKGR